MAWMKIWTDYSGSSKTFDWFQNLTRCKFSCFRFLWSHLTNNRVYQYIFQSSIQDPQVKSKTMLFVSHLYFDRVKRPSSGWVAVTSITHHYYMKTKKFENLHALQRKINTSALLLDPKPRPKIPSTPLLSWQKWIVRSSSAKSFSSGIQQPLTSREQNSFFSNDCRLDA